MNATRSSPLASPLARLGVAAALLLLEYLALSLWFDARALHAARGRWAALGLVGELATVAMLAAAAALALGRHSLRAQLQTLPGDDASLWRRWPLALVHAALVVLLAWATARLFGTPATASLALVGAWLSLVLLVAVTAFSFALPWTQLRGVLPRVGAALGIGLLAGAAAWLLGQASTRLWGSLGGVTLEVVVFELGQLTTPVIVDRPAMIVGTEAFQVVLGPECSGLEGMGLMIVFLSAYIGLNRSQLHLLRSLAVIPLAVVLTWLLNTVRIVVLILIGTHWSPAVALGGFHSKAGWLLFCAVAFVFILLMERARVLHREPDQNALADESEPALTSDTAAYLVPQLLILGVGLLTGLMITDFDVFYPLRVLAAALALWLYRAHYRGLWDSVSWQAVAIGVAVYGLWIALLPRGVDAPSDVRDSLEQMPRAAAAAWIAARIVGSVAIVPIVEELAFRGYVLRRLISRDFTQVSWRQLTPLSFIGSSLAFGALHGGAWLAGSLAGAAFALAQARQGRFSDAVIAHAVANALIAADVLLFGAWGLW